MKQIWYLTGGICSGKSTVLKEFERFGFDTFSADKAAAKVRERNSAQIMALLGTDSPCKLREIIFNNPVKKHQLEELVVPGILGLMHDAIQQSPKEVFVAELPVLYTRPNTGTGLITVEAPVADRIKRLMERDKISEDLAIKTIASQPSGLQRRSIADVVLENICSPMDLLFQLKVLCQMISLWSKSQSV